MSKLQITSHPDYPPSQTKTKLMKVARLAIYNQNDHAVLFGLRDTSTNPQSMDKWELPGGKVEGRSLAETAEREAKEELGVDAMTIGPFNLCESRFFTSDKYPDGVLYVACCALAIVLNDSKTPKAGDEMRSYAWIPLKIMGNELKPAFRPGTYNMLKEVELLIHNPGSSY